MKNSSGSAANAKGSKKAKIAYALVAFASVAIIVLTVVLAVVFSRPEDIAASAPPADDKTDAPAEPAPSEPADGDAIKFGLPLAGATVIREASLDMLVYYSSLNFWESHNGVDLAAAENESVMTVAAGKVVDVTETTLEGVCVTVEHGDGFVTVYKSLSSASVATGDAVAAGAEIGKAGTMMTEAGDKFHVHLEMTLNGELVDPLRYIDIGGEK